MWRQQTREEPLLIPVASRTLRPTATYHFASAGSVLVGVTLAWLGDWSSWLIAGAVLLLLFAVVRARSCVAMVGEELVVRNGLFTRHVPVSSIQEVTTTPDGVGVCPAVLLSSGRTVRLLPLAAWTNSRAQESVESVRAIIGLGDIARVNLYGDQSLDHTAGDRSGPARRQTRGR